MLSRLLWKWAFSENILDCEFLNSSFGRSSCPEEFPLYKVKSSPASLKISLIHLKTVQLDTSTRGRIKLNNFWFWPLIHQFKDCLIYSLRVLTPHKSLSFLYSWNSKFGGALPLLQFLCSSWEVKINFPHLLLYK